MLKGNVKTSQDCIKKQGWVEKFPAFLSISIYNNGCGCQNTKDEMWNKDFFTFIIAPRDGFSYILELALKVNITRYHAHII